MLISLYCKDTANSQYARQEKLNEHLRYIEKIISKIKVAGPLFDDTENNMIGSLLIVEADSPEQAIELLEGDPYYKAGVWAEVKAAPFKGVAGEWVGGKNW